MDNIDKHTKRAVQQTQPSAGHAGAAEGDNAEAIEPRNEQMLRQSAQMACVIAAATVATPATADRANQADQDTPLVSGAFIQLNDTSASEPGDWWGRQVAAMNAVGMDTVVIQYSGYGDEYFYPTDIQGVKPNETDSLEHILKATDEAGMRVFLGLQLSDTFWGGSFDGDANLKRNRATLEELYARYGSHASLSGWYIPEEISDHTQRKPQFAEDLLDYIGSISTLAKERTGLPVMISPYFGQEPDAAAYAKWWDQTALPRLHVDILAMQDGVGTHRTTIEESRPVYEALRPILLRHGVTFWANNECFDQTHGWPVDDRAWAAQPAGFETFMAQVRSTAPMVEKSITFEFTTYISPMNPGLSKQLYQAYRDYYANVIGDKKPAAQTTIPRPVIKTTLKGTNNVAPLRQD